MLLFYNKYSLNIWFFSNTNCSNQERVSQVIISQKMLSSLEKKSAGAHVKTSLNIISVLPNLFWFLAPLLSIKDILPLAGLITKKIKKL